jgi:hypothetical protein
VKTSIGACFGPIRVDISHTSASRPSGEWSDDDYDVLAEGVVVGRIMKAAASPAGTP